MFDHKKSSEGVSPGNQPCYGSLACLHAELLLYCHCMLQLQEFGRVLPAAFRTLTTVTQLQSFVVGPKFKGVKMLPPGPHLISYNAAGTSGEFAPTVSFFLYLKPGQVVVRRWDAAAEMLVELADEDEVCPTVARLLYMLYFQCGNVIPV